MQIGGANRKRMWYNPTDFADTELPDRSEEEVP